MRRSRLLSIGLLVVLAVWCAISVTETWPLAGPLGGEQLSGWQVFLAVVGVGLFAAAALGYLRLYLRRPRAVRAGGHVRIRVALRGDGRDRLGT